MTLNKLGSAAHVALNEPRSGLSLALGEYRYAAAHSLPMYEARAQLLGALPIRQCREYSLADFLHAVEGRDIARPAPVQMPGKVDVLG